MKRKLLNLLLFFILMMSVGCASSYKPINPSNADLQTNIEGEDLNFSYEYDLLAKIGNKKYSKMEKRDNLKLIAVKIENKTKQEVLVSQDIGFYVNNKEVTLLQPYHYTHNMKQNTISYLFYLLLTPLKLIIQDENGSSGEIPVGYVLGPGITLINMIKSNSANSAFEKELTDNNIIGKSIAAGETLTGIISIEHMGYSPLTIKLKD